MDNPFYDCDPTSTDCEQRQQDDANLLHEQHLSLAARRKARKRFMDTLYARNRRLREKEEEIDLKRKVKQIITENTKVNNENNALQSILDSAKRHIETTMNETEKQWLETVIQRVTATTEEVHRSDPTTDGKNKHNLNQDGPNRLECCDTSTIRPQNPRGERKVSSSSMQNKAVKRRRSGASSNSVQSSKRVRDSETTGTATIARTDAIETSLLRPFNIGNCINNSLSMTLSTFPSPDVLSNNKSDGKNDHVFPLHPSNRGASANHNTNVGSASNNLETVRPSTNDDASINYLEIIRQLLDGTMQQFSTISTNTSVQSLPLTTTSSTSDNIVAGLLHAQHYNTQQHEAERNEALRRSAYAINCAQQHLNQVALQSLEQHQRSKLLLSLYGDGRTINSNILSTPTISNNLSLPQQPVTREGTTSIQSLASLLESLISTANHNNNRTASQSFSSSRGGSSHTPNSSDDFAALAAILLQGTSQNKSNNGNGSINDNTLFGNYPISAGLESTSQSTNRRFSNDLDTFSSQSSNIREAYLRLSNNTNLLQSPLLTQNPQHVQQHLPSANQNLSNTEFVVPPQPPNMLESYFQLLSNTSNHRLPMLTLQSRNYNQQQQHQMLPQQQQQQQHSTNLPLHPQQQQLNTVPTPTGSLQQDEQHLAQKQLLLQKLMQILR